MGLDSFKPLVLCSLLIIGSRYLSITWVFFFLSFLGFEDQFRLWVQKGFPLRVHVVWYQSLGCKSGLLSFSFFFLSFRYYSSLFRYFSFLNYSVNPRFSFWVIFLGFLHFDYFVLIFRLNIWAFSISVLL